MTSILPTVELQRARSARALYRMIRQYVPTTGWAVVEVPNLPLLDMLDALRDGVPTPDRAHPIPWIDTPPADPEELLGELIYPGKTAPREDEDYFI